MSLKNIQSKIRSVEKTHKVTKAIEAVSAVKMRKSQERALNARPYAISALQILKRVSGSVDVLQSPLTIEREVQRTCFLVVTSDKGLAGSLNNAVLKEVNRVIANRGLTKESLVFLCIGNKGYDYFSKRGFKVLENFQNISDEVSIEDMKIITEKCVELYSTEEVDQCIAVYTNFISTFEQRAHSRVLLPLSLPEIERVVEDIVPTKGKFAEEKKEEKTLQYTLEPDSEDILEELLPFLLNIELYHILLEAKASEHSARMVAMKNASDKAEDIFKELNIKYNKERQAQITSEVSEIIGGIEALA